MGRTSDERIADRKATTDFMMRMYCRKKHGYYGLCPECRELLDYACERIDDCPNRVKGIRCAGCPTRCYSAEMRERMGDVIGFCRPRMVLHPVMIARWR
jgi:hypothetical protein